MLQPLDIRLINFFRRISIPLARLGIFIIFFWFGALKVINLSPASPLVAKLFNETISFLSFPTFLILFGLFECLIGILFLIRGAERVVIPLLFLHLLTTFMPLWLLPAVTWRGLLVPTLEGQYIIKNILIITAAITIAANLDPLPRPKTS